MFYRYLRILNIEICTKFIQVVILAYVISQFDEMQIKRTGKFTTVRFTFLFVSGVTFNL